MALVLGMEVGQSVYIGKDKLTLEKIITPQRFRVKLEGSLMDQIFEITDKERTEILPDVNVQAGKSGNMQVVKIAIEARPDKVILREKVLKRHEQQVTGSAKGS